MPAPLIVFGYRRPEHLRKTLEAASRDPLSSSTALHIFLDGPKHEKDQPAALACRQIAEDSQKNGKWAAVRISASATNQGLAKSVLAGVSSVLGAHDRAIILEDDLVVSPGFLAYMNAALDRYANDPAVFSACGYCPPIRWKKEPATDAVFFERCNSYGWATWKDRWRRVDWSMEKAIALKKDRALMRRFERGGNDLPAMLGAQIQGKVHSWAVRWSLAHTENQAYCLYPTRTFLENIGFDGSGTHLTPKSEQVKSPRNRAVFDPAAFRWPRSTTPDPEAGALLRAHFNMPRIHYWRLRLMERLR